MTNCATPTQLVFDCNATFNILFKVDWQHSKERNQHRIVQNNKAENSEQTPHAHHPGDEAMVEADPSNKMTGQRFVGP